MVTISFIGDIGLNDDYIALQEQKIDPFSAIKPGLSGSDLVAGNLECFARGDQGENLLKRPRIWTTVETLQLLKEINLGIASLATNHVYDHLEDGFNRTLNFLQANQILFLGAATQPEEASRPCILEKNGISFCFLNYITPDTHPSLPAGSKVYLNEFRLQDCLEDLRKNEACHFKIVMMHWGGNFEGGLYPDPDQGVLARKMIDHGADLIIGHHTHTLQPFEIYKGKYIFYSLGNFCFSDIHFEGKIRKMSSRRERESVIVQVNFNPGNYSLELIPFRNEQLILRVRTLVLFKLRLRNALYPILKFGLFWKIYRVYFKKIRPLCIQLFRKDAGRSLYSRIVNYKPGKV